jgi:membrane fusion protein (multidrug efflux system)
MAKRMILMIVFLLLVFGGIFGWKAIQGYYMGQYFATMKPPPETVSSAKVAEQTWQATLGAVGTLRAVKGVEVSAEVEGMIKTLNFTSGQPVKVGDLLVQLDDESDRAELDGLVASKKLAELNLQRERSLAKRNLGSEADLDTARTKLDEARAQAQFRQVMLAKKAIRAPFDGELGIRMVDVGEYLSAGKTIVSLQALDPLYAEFSLPEQELGRVSKGQSVSVTVDAYPGQEFPGTITAVDVRVDDQTRNVRVQATLANPQRVLRPGMFANVKIQLGEQRSAAAVPRTAISYSLYGNFVYVIEDAGKDAKGKPVRKVTQRFVVTGDDLGEQVAVLKGVKPGEEVVTAGQLKLRDGAEVTVKSVVTAKQGA